MNHKEKALFEYPRRIMVEVGLNRRLVGDEVIRPATPSAKPHRADRPQKPRDFPSSDAIHSRDIVDRSNVSPPGLQVRPSAESPARIDR
jgi:hypothetical protein